MKRLLFALILAFLPTVALAQLRGDAFSSRGRRAFETCINVFGVNVCSGAIAGSGTTNSIAKFTAISTIGDSGITDDGAIVAFTVASPAANTNIYDFVIAIPITAAGQTTNIINVQATNPNHTGGTVNMFTGNAITGDPDAVENFIKAPAGYDNPINLADPSYSFLTSILLADGGIIEADGSGGGGSMQMKLGTADPNSTFFVLDGAGDTLLEITPSATSGFGTIHSVGIPASRPINVGLAFMNATGSGTKVHTVNTSFFGLRLGMPADTCSSCTLTTNGLELSGWSDPIIWVEGGFTTTVDFTAPTVNRTITFPDADGTVGFEIAVNQDFDVQAAQLANPATNDVRLYVDESTNRVGGAGNDCVLVARLANGTEVNIAILVTDGGC